MSKKLKFNEVAESMGAINQLMRDSGSKTFNANIHVYDYNRKELLLQYFNSRIDLGIDSQRYHVNILWEDYGLNNYHDFGLWGYYSTDFINMKYDKVNRCLSIYAKDDNRLIEIEL